MARGPRSWQVHGMRPRRVYWIAVTGGCWHRSLAGSTERCREDVMRRRQVLVLAAGAALLLGTGCAQVAAAKTAAARAGGSWGRAITVPGLAALNTGRNANVLSVSCPAPGSCAAGGYYQNHGKHGFVVSESNGRWHRA